MQPALFRPWTNIYGIGDVTPISFVANHVDRSAANAKTFSQRDPVYLAREYLSDVAFCQKSPSMLLSLAANLPAASLRRHIFQVFGLRPEKQMIRVDTRWNVTFVTDIHSGWDWSIN
jgi:hypothetical protein